VFSLGANDATHENGKPRVAQAETLWNRHTLLDIANARFHTLLIGPPAVPDAEHNARLGRLSQRMAEVAARSDIAYLALFPLLVNDAHWLNELRANGGAHPRAAGLCQDRDPDRRLARMALPLTGRACGIWSNDICIQRCSTS
jgi:lysophospholipase L1-like esterase